MKPTIRKLQPWQTARSETVASDEAQSENERRLDALTGRIRMSSSDKQANNPTQPLEIGARTPAILIVEDDLTVLALLVHIFERAGYRVRALGDGVAAVAEALREPPDIVLLDVRITGMLGWDVCREIKSRIDIPIVFISAWADDESIVRGLRLGADDFIAKPFSGKVLLARVEAVLRRSRTNDGALRELRHGHIRVDLSNSDVWIGTRRIALTPTEFRILVQLMHHVGEVVPSRDLLRAAQGYDLAEREANQILKVHVSRLRDKLEDESYPGRLITSRRGLGYFLGEGHTAEEVPPKPNDTILRFGT